MILQVNGIHFSYPGNEVLYNAEFSAKKGEFVAILGPNGTGKTTLLKCINKILKPSLGTVYMGPINIHQLKGNELAKKIGYVEQNRSSSRTTVFNAVLLGRKPHIKWDVSPEDIEIVGNVLHSMNISKFAMRYLDELSGGEVQKVIIARSLAQKPELLLMDEPTNHLDLKNQVEVMETIREIIDEGEVTTIVTMHDINLALRYADRFILMKGKGIYAAGGKEVITTENIEAVYSVPVTIIDHEKQQIVVPA
ncbi:MAG: ABC transporter ATP-binding protein [Tissierellia bacterium]|nr:ABC transporter ATP-binding protein [Tissierellia bacterium]